MADRVKRRELAALIIVGVCSAFGFAMGCTGGRAFLREPCSTFAKPKEDVSRCVDQIAVVTHLEADPPPTPPPAPPPVRPTAVVDIAAAPPPVAGMVTVVSLRGPPRARVRTIGHTRIARTGGNGCLHMTGKHSGSS
jgi:hypothetical protein